LAVIVAASAPLPPNGFDPLPAARIARTQAQLARMDLMEKTARAAVLGYCSSSPDFIAQGVNVAANVAQTPAVVMPSVTSSSTVTNSGSGVLDSSLQNQPVAPTVVPMSESVPNPPQYGPLTLQTSRGSNGGSKAWCTVTQPTGRARQQVPAGIGPQWGDPFMRTVLAQTAGTTSPGAAIVSWMQQHGALAAALFVGGLLVAGAAMGGSRKGR